MIAYSRVRIRTYDEIRLIPMQNSSSGRPVHDVEVYKEELKFLGLVFCGGE